MSRVRFTAALVKRGQHLCFDLPGAASTKLGHAGRVPVSGTLNTFPIRTSVFPDGDGGHYMMVNPEMQKMVGLAVGDSVRVTLEVDAREPEVHVPADLDAALERHAEARCAFERLAPSHQQEYLSWIEEAKRPETRARRIEKTVERLLQTPSPED